MRRFLPRSLRGRLLLVVIAGAAAFVALLTAGFNVFLSARLDRDATEVLRQRATAHLATLETRGGRITVEETADRAVGDTPIWVFAGTRPVEHPRAGARSNQIAARLARSNRRVTEDSAGDTRYYALPVLRGADRHRLGTIVSAVSLVPYERTRQAALVASVVFALLVVVAVALASRWAIASALRPVAEMTAQAAARSERDLDRRFDLGEPRDELTRLAATFDGLLARVSASLRHEQRFSAELSHELRTPLTRLIGEVDLALRRPRGADDYREALVAVRTAGAQMQRTLESLLAAARAEGAGAGRSDARAAAAQAIEHSAAVAGERRVAVALDAPGPARVGADEDVTERILAPVIENAVRYASSRVQVELARRDGQVEITVADDGPGVVAGERERVFEPGFRGAAASAAPGGAGLGLPLARRLARAVHGDVDCLPAERGAAFRVRLPAA